MKKTLIALAIAATLAVIFGKIVLGAIDSTRTTMGLSNANMQQAGKTEAEREALANLPGLD